MSWLFHPLMNLGTHFCLFSKISHSLTGGIEKRFNYLFCHWLEIVSLTDGWLLMMFALFCMYLEDQLPAGFPTIDMGPQLKVVERSRTATMLCAASGNPDPEISWFKDFLPVNTSSNNGRIKQLRSGKQNFDHFFIFLFPNSSFFFLTPFLIPISNLLLLQTMILILLIFNPCFLAADSPSCVVASCDILADFVCCCCCDTSWLCMIPNPSILYQTFWNRLPTVL